MAATAKPTANAVPRMLGRYHVLEELARVPLGYSHLARYEGSNGFQRWSTLLRVDERFAEDADFRRAFFESARRAVRIQHPNVALTLDVGETDGVLWVARDHLLSETADDLLRAVLNLKVPVPWDIAVRMVADAALGLVAIHELGPDGRIGPHRLAITYDGSTKVLDPCWPDASIARGPDPRALPYTAPEVLWQENVDHRADIFSLGVVLWELCAGRTLFVGHDDQETRALIEAHEVPPLRKVIGSVPLAVEELLRKALKPNPERRYESAKVFARSLQAALVKETLIVTDDDVGRYMLSIFAERFQVKEERLSSAAEVTEVYAREGEARADTGDVSAPTEVFASPTAHTQVFSSKGKIAARVPMPGESDGLRPPLAQFPPPPPPSMRLRVPPATPPPPSVRPPPVMQAPSLSEFTPPPRSVPSWPAQHQPPAPPGFAVARTAQLHPASAGMEVDVPRSSRAPAFAPRTPLPPSYGGPASRRSPLPPQPARLSAELEHEERTGMSPALLFVVLAIAVGVLAVLIFIRFRGHDEAGIEIPTASSVPSSPAPRSSSSAARASASGSANVKAASSASSAAASASASTNGPSATSPDAGDKMAKTTTKRRASHSSSGSSSSSSSSSSSDSSRSSSATNTSDESPTPPPSMGGGGRGQLTVVCVPACDEVFDGKTSLGPSPIFKRSASLGSHHLTLRIKDPLAEKVVDVEVGGDEPTVVHQPMGH